MLDWDYEANKHDPEYYTNGSGEVVSWKCHKCGHKWKTPICDRTTCLYYRRKPATQKEAGIHR
ncbi:MAG: zinc-ribbon domain-containing protein [Oscillospiraceae bacterium]|nr:zinc-ribbon domain-containing protein [Oscillospiraceae bacterium]